MTNDPRPEALRLVSAAFANWHGAAGLWTYCLDMTTRALSTESRLASLIATRALAACPRQPECPHLVCLRGHPVFFHANRAMVVRAWGCADCDEWLSESATAWVLAAVPRTTGESKGCT